MILVIHFILALAIIGLVLLQHGKGADAGAAFGSGASGTVFGSQGSGNFLTRTTTACALLFAVTSISLTLLANKGARPATLSEKLMQQESTTAVAPVAAPNAATSTPEVPAAPATVPAAPSTELPPTK